MSYVSSPEERERYIAFIIKQEEEAARRRAANKERYLRIERGFWGLQRRIATVPKDYKPCGEGVR